MTDYTAYGNAEVSKEEAIAIEEELHEVEAGEPEHEEIQNESEQADAEFLKEKGFQLGQVVNCRTVNLRKGPNKNADVLAILPVGECVKILKNQGKGWFTVATEDCPKGYIMEEFVKEI